MFPMLLVAALAAAAPIFARASEGIWGIAPCALCLWQRWPYWVAAALALAAAAWPRGRRLLGGLALVAVLASGAVGGFHVGVEQGWWPSPLPGCQAPRAGSGGSVEDMLRALSAAPSKPCDAPTYLVPGLPVSMAAMNVLYALGLSGLGLILWRRGAKA
ncbi:disulfide bond formation protein B [Dankookia sp. GCM10030260]|uniref:disulfide bond formation protein B n=1 Tax=Dankookia sp. GCM10030260 TaxID=3273390 RepID=UPI0036D40B36